MTGSERDAMLARFYSTHAQTLERRIARRVRGVSRALIEDACQTAWMTLVRRPDVPLDQGGLAWLSTVAAHEAFRLLARGPEVPALVLPPSFESVPGPGVLATAGGEQGDPSERALAVEGHEERVEDFLRLKPREREALYLQALGYSYREIAVRTGATYTAVNRRITEGRSRLRALAAERDDLGRVDRSRAD